MKRERLSPAVEAIIAERSRQVAVVGYSAAHDDGHTGGELALAAATYAAPVRLFLREEDDEDEIRFIDPWPFEAESDERVKIAAALRAGQNPGLTPTAWRMRLLTISGALIVAELERLHRLQEACANGKA